MSVLYNVRGLLVSPPCPWLLPEMDAGAELAVREAQASVGRIAHPPGIRWALEVWHRAGLQTPEGAKNCLELWRWAIQTTRWSEHVASLGAIALYGNADAPTALGIVIRLEPEVVALIDDDLITVRRAGGLALGYCHARIAWKGC